MPSSSTRWRRGVRGLYPVLRLCGLGGTDLLAVTVEVHPANRPHDHHLVAFDIGQLLIIAQEQTRYIVRIERIRAVELARIPEMKQESSVGTASIWLIG